MTALLFIVAILGWLVATVLFISVMMMLLALGATQNLEPDDEELSMDQINKGTRTLLWSPHKEKEIPFGD